MTDTTPSSIVIPDGFAPRVYLLDPDTEDLIFGDQLTEGMVVLLEDSLLRHDADDIQSQAPITRAKTLETARWCRVDAVRRNGHIVAFIGEYADGSKLRRSYANHYAWFVKKNSIPR